MSTAPASGARTGHDWLIVGTAAAATRDADAAREPSAPWRLWLGTAMALAGTLRQRTADIVHGGRAAGEKTAAALVRAVRERSVPGALATLDRYLGRPLLRIGSESPLTKRLEPRAAPEGPRRVPLRLSRHS